VEYPEVFWGVIASMYIGNAMLVLLNLPLVGLWVQLLKVPYAILAPIVVMICSIGVFGVRNDPAEIFIMLIFGILGYILRKVNFDTGPLLLAFILGPIIERSLRQALIISGGDFSVFVRKPLSAALLGVAVLLLVWQIILTKRGRKRQITAA